MDTQQKRKQIKDEFRYFLSHAVRSTRRIDNSFNLDNSAVGSFLSFIENTKRLFDYNPTKWAHITSMYDITDPQQAKDIVDDLLNDEDFIKRDQQDNKMFRSGALMHYVCFLFARSYFENLHVDSNSKITDLENKVNKREYALQQIYYGAPGTGKSHAINERIKGKSVIRTTFHPDSDYSTFVGAYKPTMRKITMRDLSGHPIKEGGQVLTEDKIIYEFVDQAFLQAYIKAWKFYAETQDVITDQYLVIEEINRGNCAQIFGDLFQLLDRNDAGFSVYPIHADKDVKKQLEKAFEGLNIDKSASINRLYGGRDIIAKVLSGDILLLPNNLYIWATMNTSDQSLFPIDSAFKRRWDWQYMPIGKGYDENGYELKWAIEGNTKQFSWWSFLEKINAQIGQATQSEDKKLGFFFCKAIGDVISAEKFVGKVIFYLWNDVFKSCGFDGPIFKDVDGTELSFAKFYQTDRQGKAIVQKDKVEQFLNNLEVEVVGESEAEEEKLEVSITGGPVDRSKYSFNGEGKYGKSSLGLTIMKEYITKHPELTLDQLQQTFPDSMLNSIPGPGLIVKEGKAMDSYSRYYVSGFTSSDGIKYSIFKQWTIGNIDQIIGFANKQGWSVDKL